MSKIVLNDVTNLNTLSVINDNFDKIELEFQNKALYRDNPDGEPNALQNDIDANGNSIYNVQDLTIQGSFTVNGKDLETVIDEATQGIEDNAIAAENAAVAAAASASAANASANAAAASEANAQDSETAAAASESNAATSATNAASSASTATTQAGIATTKASEASTSASNAATSASTATTQAGIATTGASTATTKASEAAASAAAALASETAAAGYAASIDPATVVRKDSDTGAAQLPAGTTAQRPTGATGKIRANTTLNKFEGYINGAWGSIGGGATGGGADDIFIENGQTVTQSYTITSGKNAGSFGPISIANGATVTIPSGSVWTIV